MSVVVIEFVTLDGRVSDPDGRAGTPYGGWAFRYGPDAVGGDKFRLGGLLDTGVLLLGRRTWELFAEIWPGRDDPFAAQMNAASKLVASRTLSDVSAWQNSALVSGDLVEAVRSERRDVIVTGSPSVVHTLMGEDLIDEYRLLTLPTAVGEGTPLFPPGRSVDLECRTLDRTGAAVYTQYARAGR
ncbi:dihydrofolate reductase family protein [Nocardia blacklockiae]|uniref:dihydrofolate reductase family protein n=1 Tax=Nocardia blacklockiae TaxID=480036 RepID=UPI0018948336|nr:dihydrofolate reductase family protein [Nocardia blacklockiae]MBF6176259.1 dihydrofolate reductase family protein [Nocardia blacklockiae]